jgi:hypothetical protein
MNAEMPNQPEPFAQELLDRLVDDELDIEARRRLLTELDRQPGGWRRCALSFLEAQAWQRHVQRTLNDPRRLPETEIAARQRAAWRRNLTGAAPWLATAACLVVGFYLGRDAHSWRQTDSRGAPQRWQGRVADVAGRTTSPDAVLLPDDWSPHSVLSPDLVRGFERLGARVRHQRGVVSAVRSDGSPVYVPYEDVEIVPARHGGY